MTGPRIKLTYLDNEWEILHDMAVNKGSKNFRSYLNNRIHLLAKKNVSLLTSDKKHNDFIIPYDICAEIIAIARQRQIPLASVIRWYVADPLLKEYYDKIK